MGYDYNRDAEPALCTRCLGVAGGTLHGREGWRLGGVGDGAEVYGFSAFAPSFARWNDREGGLDETFGRNECVGSSTRYSLV